MITYKKKKGLNKWYEILSINYKEEFYRKILKSQYLSKFL